MRFSTLGLVLLANACACGGRSALGDGVPSEAGTVADAAPEACGPSTCAGCCDDGGACRAGTESAACGADGEQCQTCDPRYDLCNPRGGGGHVSGLACWSPCDFRSCGGCCQKDGTCMPGNADDACGSPPTLCIECTTSGKVCGAVGSGHGCVGG